MPHHTRFRHWIGLLGAAASLMLWFGCTPKGKIVQNITAITSPDAGEAQTLAAREVPDPGKPREGAYAYDLPKFCNLVASPDSGETCIVCTANGLPLERCFPTTRSFATRTSCGHNQRELKCLINGKNPLLTLSFESSEESEFTKNFPVFLSTVRAIAQTKMTANQGDLASAVGVLEYFQAASGKVLDPSQKSTIIRDIDALLQKSNVPAASRAATLRQLNTNLDQISHRRRHGRLSLRDGQQLAKTIISPLPAQAVLTRIMSEISLDGLENPSDLNME